MPEISATWVVPPTPRPPRHAGDAREVADRILDRLADPEVIAAEMVADSASDGARGGAWRPWSSASAGAALALRAAHGRPDLAAPAHTHLARAVHALPDEPAGGGLYGGSGQVSVATLVAHRVSGGYLSALEQVDAHHRATIHATLRSPADYRVDRPVRSNAEFEVIRGLAGTGRYLLARRETCEPELRTVLRHLVAMGHGTVPLHGHRVPRWWTYAPLIPGHGVPDPDGHLNLGLSHGIAGPLALLALACTAGVEVDGQRQAIENLVGLVVAGARSDGAAVRWPAGLTLSEWTTGTGLVRDRFSWCYAAPGMSRAVQLAAAALDRPDWHDLVHRSLSPLLDTPPEAWETLGAGLCHGSAGLAHLLGRLDEHVGDDRLPARRDDLVARTVAAYQGGLRFDAGTPPPRKAPDPTEPFTLLDGAAGIALALDAYATGTVTGGWDMALLVS